MCLPPELTSQQFKTYAWVIVKRFIHLALLIGALLGFLGHGVAMAMSPNCDAAMVQPARAQLAKNMSTAGTMDCGSETSSGKNGSKPVKDTMPNCPMMAGCFVSLAMGSVPAMPAMIPIKGATAYWALVTRLASRATAPEPPPPTI
ncbi:MAG: hypothetical protein ABIW31_03530 [Novosphingobium sp.]